MVTEERAETHRQKFVIGIMMDKKGEATAIEELEKAGIVHTRFRPESGEGKEAGNHIYQNQTCVTLVRNDNKVYLQPRKQIRLIVKGPGILLLACISANGNVKQERGNRLVVDFRTKTMAKRVVNILPSYEDDNDKGNINATIINTNSNNNFDYNDKYKNKIINLVLKKDQ